MKQLLIDLHARADKHDRADAPELFARLDAWVASQTPTAKTERAVIQALHDTTETVAVDDNPAVEVTDQGTWVQAWIYVGDATCSKS